MAADVDALVNTVNTVGVMGKGVAYQFKQAFPENFRAYEVACKKNEVSIGRMFVTLTGMLHPRLIVNFPTKRHWKGNSKIEDIQAGLADLVRVVREEKIRSIALPPLGCGLGGLRWEDVRPLIETAFEAVPHVEVHLYPPGQAVAPAERVVRTAKPPMNAWRAALIKVVEAYGALGFEATHIEAQKLLYFLVKSGEPVKVNFAKGKYGPFDEGMRHALQLMDGHYVIGFGDGGRLEPVRLTPTAADEADRYLAAQDHHAEALARIARVTELIDGFETPYGLELLATLDWVANDEGARTAEEAIRLAHAWNPRKARVMKAEHLRIAWERLVEGGWVATA